MLVKGRTILLILVIIQLCLQYSILYEAIKSMNSVVQLTIFDVEYLYLFDLLLSIILIPAMLFNILLFLYGLRTHTKRKKKFVVFVFGFNFIIVVPYFISGIYLYICATASGETKLNKEVHDVFRELQDVFHGNKEFTKETAFADVVLIQKTFCCCGLHGPADWGEKFKNKDYNATVIVGRTVFSCPVPAVYKDSSCMVSHFEGCASKLIRIKRSFIFISSIICLCCSIIEILISPCIYASFEHDRRLARAAHIRTWRKKLEAELDRERREDYEDEVLAQTTKKVEKNDVLAMKHNVELTATKQEGENGSVKEELGLNKSPELEDASVKSLCLSKTENKSFRIRSFTENSDKTNKSILKLHDHST